MAAKRQKTFGWLDVSLPPARRARPSGFATCSSARALWKTGLILVTLSSGASGQTPSPRTEYEIMAQFLYRFAMFIEWPKESFADEKAPIVFAVVGDDPFDEHLEQTLKGKSIEGRPLVLKRFKEVKDIESCHVLFVSKSLKDSFKDVLTAVKGKHIVTVSDIDDFAEKGGMFRFFIAEKKMRFKINLTEMKRTGVTISSRLLQVAVTFEEEKRETK